MAIPNWLWPDGELGTEVQSDNVIDPSELKGATDTFAVLSHPTRLEILTHLFDQSRPVSYTELRKSIAIQDKGRFNYHLRQLEDLVRPCEGKYILSQRGAELVQSVLSEKRLLTEE
ncbi:ArsR/SmtB family transcription factor [Haloferax sulfurifontis]|uniref:Transcriptional regulator n=1 Tax=Haloferax sulfurifontis ATCC BAA-897 TaxID=662480 RepID=M0IIV5_9EURY|nr:helix-turn-helix domain-containing protein [Haloferax sulfurifontis]ELZ96690.1 transcriptional regulator [Haloferax sulfurifontis ATCC BAA-897]